MDEAWMDRAHNMPLRAEASSCLYVFCERARRGEICLWVMLTPCSKAHLQIRNDVGSDAFRFGNWF